ncbi:hypothetical protein GCM10011521_12130 [Arenimonas soli]|uniref:Uncharacterized protein n=1 Tax=Arenimonas soli TaxID=2269504 RepID=A0ABQ1HFM7_9GAMM|nr:hypothetical protein [Arenimonas soli]GGA75547.1 hypothetical protein GCM10011521_12130 [Arenimonas soli]
MAAALKKTSRKPPPAPGPGRPKGSKNKVPAELKKALQMALDGFATEIPSLLRKVAAKDPARALELVARLGEYVVPKLGRTEHALSGATLESLVAGAVGPETPRPALNATPSGEQGRYTVPLESNPAGNREPLGYAQLAGPVRNTESAAPTEPRPSDITPSLPNLPREGLTENERTVADLRAKACRPLFEPDYDPHNI